MSLPAAPIDRLKRLLRELFQLSTADLDFGLYRLFHLKRTEVEAFLNEQLQTEVTKAFASAAGADREALEKRLQELAQRARETVADDAILPSGDPNPAHSGAKAVKEYVEARLKLQAIEASVAQQAEVFNLLYGFFSRYYDDGDFIARRFFGARPAYAVPYNGEEVHFHWANRDQYYVKSGEAFRDYAFTVPNLGGDYRVRFQLVEATTAKDNTKGDVRFFFPLMKEVAFDKTTRTLTVPFHYRLPTEEEVAKNGKNSKGQEALLNDAAAKIIEAVPDNMLKAALAEPSSSSDGSEEDSQSLLRRRLAHFTKKNTSDFFVHKNLGAFLRQELEFFLRDQVVHEADLEGDFDAKRRTIRVFRKLADALITFLAQVEDAQKKLFEKKKFVLRTDYLLPIQQVPRSLWPEVLANKEQLNEWKDLYSFEPKSDLFNLKGKFNEHVLEQHPTLVVDTQHFPAEFAMQLTAEFDDLDEQIDGTLIHGENFQALGLILPSNRSAVKCVYIDPPYNTDAGPIAYKNGYRSSSWVALIENRVTLAKQLLCDDGVICVTIDDYQVHELAFILDQVFGRANLLGVAVIRNNPSGRSTVKGFSVCHEYAFFYRITEAGSLARLHRSEKQLERFTEEAGVHVDWRNFRKDGGAVTHRAARPKQFYPIYVRPSDKTFRLPKLEWNEGKRDWDVLEKPGQGEVAVLPIDEKSKERVWSLSYFSARERLRDLQIKIDRDGKPQVHRKHIPSEGVLPRSWWDKNLYAAREYGSAALTDLFGHSAVFSFAKSPFAVQDAIWVAGLDEESEEHVVDFFGGSGTTAHATINLNRQDGGRRKFTLVEVGNYFDAVLLQRVKKVMFSPEWKDGKPKRVANAEEAERTPRLIKIIRLESYEDALHNTFSDKAVERFAERESAYKQTVGEGEYRIRYMVRLPTEASESMLNLAKLEHPFDYSLKVLTDHGPKTMPVDLVETFNWLYGLRVHRFISWINKEDKKGKDKTGRFYRVVSASDREGKKRILVIWRDMTGLDPALERSFLETKAKELGPFEEHWINGDSAAPSFASLDGLFKRLMEEPAR